MKPVLEFRSVRKIYPAFPQPVVALDSASFTLEAGEFAAVIGPSGSGKTTLLNLAAWLDYPSEGEVLIGGEAPGALGASALCKMRRKKVGFIFQGYNLFPVLTALENVEYTCLIRGDSPADTRREALRMLDAVGLKGMADRYPTQLSGGQQQRVAVARAIVTKPDLILADEPTANLDSKTASSLIDLLEEMNRLTGATFLFSTHDPALLSRVRRRIHIKDGKLAEE
jgi:putative ABC transport system ATP-binding protein